MPKLLDILLALDPEDLRALSTIIIERHPDGHWQARLSVCRNKFSQTPNFRPGISMTAWERVADREYRLDLDEIERDRHIRAQVADVQHTAIVGRLNMARFDRDDRTTKYVIKTHAGSQAERTQWLLRLNERPENMIYSRGPSIFGDRS